MKNKDNNKTLIISLWTVVAITSIEVIIYFIFVFKPLDRIMNKDLESDAGIPSTSELFTSMFLSPLLTNSDESKTFYSNRLAEFSSDLENKMAVNEGSFVKIAETNYVVGGTVSEIKPIEKNDGAISKGYEITFENNFGNKYTEIVSDVEAQYAEVYARTITNYDYKRKYTSFANIKAGDFLVIKKSTNLLNPAEVNMHVEILRTAK